MIKNKQIVIVSIFVLAIIVFFGWFFIQHKKVDMVVRNSGGLEGATSSLQSSQTTTSSLKTYRNEEYGFEFQYPKGWTFHPNTFGSPFSKFNLIGASLEENGRPDSANSSILINIVTIDFANRAFANLKGVDVSVFNVVGKKYEYDFENIPRIGIDLPFGKYRIILGAKKRNEEVFNQIVSSFKFIR